MILNRKKKYLEIKTIIIIIITIIIIMIKNRSDTNDEHPNSSVNPAA